MNFDFSKQRDKVIFTTGRKKEWINVANILFITIDLTVASVFVQNRENPYYFTKQLVELETELSDYGFFKANRNTLINGDFIRCFEKEGNGYIARLRDGKKIPFSRRQYSKIRKMINQLPSFICKKQPLI